MIARRRWGATNSLYLFVVVSLAALVVLGLLLVRMSRQSTRAPRTAGASTQRLFLFCAAGLRPPVERIVADYEREYGVAVEVQYGGSSTLLSQIEIGKMGDLYLAGDDGYTDLAHEQGLVDERIPVATMRPVLAVHKGNPKNIQGIDDLLREDVRLALGNPDQAAIGKKTRKLLQDSGHWQAVQKRCTAGGVFKPTVPEVANDIKLGSVDAGIVWDSTAAQYPELEAIRTPELDRGTARITLGVIHQTKNPTAALRFGRYLAARDRGLKHFAAMGYQPVDGDRWAEVPELTFFAGSVNRRALGPIIEAFQRREGVAVTTVFNGCGILTAQMRAMQKNHESGFPDVYMACDVYYLQTVHELFQEAVNVSNTDIVIVVAKGNPKGIRGLADLAKPGVRLAIGQPDQCTIGVLSRRLLEAEGLYQKLLADNVVTQTATSALLVPNVTTGAVDAVLAYATDTLAERDKLDVVPIDSPLAKAIQPFGIARSSDFKYLDRRLFQTIARSRRAFESVGFGWRLGTPSQPQSSPQPRAALPGKAARQAPEPSR